MHIYTYTNICMYTHIFACIHTDLYVYTYMYILKASTVPAALLTHELALLVNCRIKEYQRLVNPVVGLLIRNV